jgi:phage terminase small subunit
MSGDLMKDDSKLNLRQERFVVEYLKQGNATQAAIAAGYSERSAYSQGERLLKNAEISRRVNECSQELRMQAKDIRLRIEQIADMDIRKAVSWDENGVQVKSSDEIDEDTIRAISAVKNYYDKDGNVLGVNLKFHDSLKALALLAKFLGMDKGMGTGSRLCRQDDAIVDVPELTDEQFALLEDPRFISLKPLLGWGTKGPGGG